MKKFMCLFIASLAFLTNVQADIQADTCSLQEVPCCFEKSVYAKVFYGTDFTRYNLNSNMGSKTLGYALSGAIGYTFYPTLSVEAEYSYRQNYRANRYYGYYVVSRRVSSYMVNVIKDFKLCTIKCVEINPFIGFGLGCDYQIYEGVSFSWQAIAGVNLPITCNTDLSLEYRLHRGGRNCYRIYDHAVGLGLTYKFN